jgi:hypothetical protein
MDPVPENRLDDEGYLTGAISRLGLRVRSGTASEEGCGCKDQEGDGHE